MRLSRLFPLLALVLLPALPARAQGVMQPLTIQGVQQQDPADVRARGMGGAFAASRGGLGALLLNPAGLTGLQRPTASLAALWQSRDWAETQHWNPNRYYAGLSLYFFDPDTYRSDPLSEPDWTHSQQALRPAFAGAGLPLTLGQRAVTLALAYHLVADLSDYDRNDNVLDPYIGQFRPAPIERPRPGEEVDVTWSRFERWREGSIQALSPAVAVEMLPGLHLGLRLSYWWGHSDDGQHRRNHGRFILREDAHDYSYEDLTGSDVWDGTSDYSGWTGAAGLRWDQGVLSLGATLQLPMVLTRSYSYDGTTVTAGGATQTISADGEDDITLPLQLTAGAALRPTDALTLSLDYHLQDYTRLEVAPGDDALDWGSVHGVRLGLEWEARERWLVRAGFRQDPQPFRIEGSGLLGQTARGTAYSAGLGLPAGPLTLDVAYEYQHLGYQDRWESNVDYNRVRKHNVLVGASYAF